MSDQVQRQPETALLGDEVALKERSARHQPPAVIDPAKQRHATVCLG
ncbi:hypothetical protein [Pseudonocardia adelaidensis]